MALKWNSDIITDELFRTKFLSIPKTIAEWIGPYGGIEGKHVLDFGCGEAETALGVALQHQPASITGIEIQNNYQRCREHAKQQLDLDELPRNLNFFQIEPGELHNEQDRFDLIYSWSVFEHVTQPMIPRVLGKLHSVLKPGGLFFMQIAPLYYSSEGSHMTPWVPEPWAHLRYQHSVFFDKLVASTQNLEHAKLLWNTYRTLNRTTASQITGLVAGAGFEILQDYRTKDECSVPTDLLHIFNEDVLTTNQIVLLLRKKNDHLFE